MMTGIMRDRGFAPVATGTPFRQLFDAGAFEALGNMDRAPEDPWDATWETDDHWKPVSPAKGQVTLRRFVDGTHYFQALGYRADKLGGLLYVAGGSMGAAAARLDKDGRMDVEKMPEMDLTYKPIVVVIHEDPDDSRLTRLAGISSGSNVPTQVQLKHLNCEGAFYWVRAAETLASSCVGEEMQKLERTVAAGPAGTPDQLTLVDGPLRHHLHQPGSDRWPLVGYIKSHSNPRLPNHAVAAAAALVDGERSPAFRIPGKGNDPAIISWYLKLRPDFGELLDGTGRIEVSETFLTVHAGERTGEWIDHLSSTLFRMRAVRASYEREHCSLHPIILLEDRLRAARGHTPSLHADLERAFRALDIGGG